MLDWGAGSYETTSAIELAPVSAVVVAAARVEPGETIIDVACGTGNAALEAARSGARVVGVDGAARLLELAAQRARADGVELDLRQGDLLALPVESDVADVAVSVFGVVFAVDPAGALRELRRVLGPDGRALFSAWLPEGPIDEMLGAIGRVVGRVTGNRSPARFAWYDPDAVAPLAAEAGLSLTATTPHRLAVRAASPEAYVDGSREHPVAVATLPLLRAAGVEDEVREAQLGVLRPANEDPEAFLVHTPYVVHELRVR